MLIKKFHVFICMSVLINLMCLCACSGPASDNAQSENNTTESSPASDDTDTAAENNAAAVTAETSSVTESAMVSQLINAAAGDWNAEEITVILNQMAVTDPAYADCWKQILSYWKESNNEDFVNIYALPDDLPDDDSLCLTVLGFGLNSDGSMQQELLNRLELALECAQKYPNAFVLVTGGATASGNPDATEADAMAEWLLANGLDSDRLIVENQSKTTNENAVFSYRILQEQYPQVTAIAIITSDYHVPMACMLFNSHFTLAAYSEMTADNNSSQAPEQKISVISNAACLSEGIYSFPLKSQAYWLENLMTYEPAH